jgi:hypothetical protein
MRVLCGSILVLLLTTPATAAVINVPGDQPTVQAGIDAALAGDEVIVACGTYLEHDIQMKSGTTLRGENGDPSCVIIDGEQLGRVIVGVDLDANTLITGLTITGGIADGGLYYGGGAHFEDSALRIEDCRFTGNYSEYKGGGITFLGCSATVSHCLFDENAGDNGGGGGGIQARESELTISDCRFENNVGTDGAGIMISHCDPIIERCVFLNNDGQFFGGAVMCNSTASPMLRNCTLVGNDAYQGGGVWANWDSHPLLENCIVAFNTDGSGLFAYDSYTHPSTITVDCSDLFHNAGGNFGGDIEDQTGMNGNFSSHPYFCDLVAGDLSLATGSPCLPEGNDCGILIGALGEGCALPTSIDTSAPERFILRQNQPNPFNPTTEIAFHLAEPEWVTLAVFDLGGRRIRALIKDELQPAGENTLRWDGRDERGRNMPTGIYLYRLDGRDWSSSRKMTLLK